MIQRIYVRAGIMLYALLMMSIFSLFLQFYLNRQVSLARINQSSDKALTAYLMADWTRDKFVEEARRTESKQERLSSSDGKESQGSEEELHQEGTDKKDEEADSRTREESGSGEDSEDVKGISKDERVILTEQNSTGSLAFKQGKTAYHYEAGYLKINVQLKEGKEFNFLFLIDSEIP